MGSQNHSGRAAPGRAEIFGSFERKSEPRGRGSLRPGRRAPLFFDANLNSLAADDFFRTAQKFFNCHLFIANIDDFARLTLSAPASRRQFLCHFGPEIEKFSIGSCSPSNSSTEKLTVSFFHFQKGD